MKICTRCRIEKSTLEFHKSSSHSDGLKPVCKKCRKEEHHKSYENKKTKEKISVEYKICVKCKLKKHCSFFDYSCTSIDSLRNICKKCRSIERREHRNIHNEYCKSRKKNDPAFKIICNLRIRIYYARKNGWKKGSTIEDLGCTSEELKQRFELMFYSNPRTGEQMTWENYGLHGWHIDHVIPLASFDLINREQFLKACHYTNLQPMWAEENLSKGNKIINE